MYFKLHHSDTILLKHATHFVTGTENFVEPKTCWAAGVVVVEAARTSQEPRVAVPRAEDQVAVVVPNLVAAV